MPRGRIITLNIPLGKIECSGKVEALETQGDIIQNREYNYKHSGSCCKKKPLDEVTIEPDLDKDGMAKIKCK